VAKKLPPVDVVLVGFGWTGAIMGNELTDAGLNVVALERGSWRDTSTDFAVTFAQDELRYYYRHALFEEPARETLTFRNNAGQTALPMRKLGSFLPGTGVGGAGIHWNGMTFRFLPSDFQARSHNIERYGAGVMSDTMTVQDWGVSYDELEPYYDKFEYLCGISGKAGNIKGQKIDGGNPFEGARTRDYPNPPLEQVYGPTLFAQAAKELGYHPFPGPAANMSRAYTNPLGIDAGLRRRAGGGVTLFAAGEGQATGRCRGLRLLQLG
jgi:gluconate 2-dehydrogenase alpha chain